MRISHVAQGEADGIRALDRYQRRRRLWRRMDALFIAILVVAFLLLAVPFVRRRR